MNGTSGSLLIMPMPIARRKTALVVSPTHAEGEKVTAAIREELKQRGKLGADERKFTRLINQQWTEAQRGNPQSYRPGLVIQFHQNAPGFTRGQRSQYRAQGMTAIPCASKTNMGDNTLCHWTKVPDSKFIEAQTLPLAPGDKIRITQNGFTADGKHRLNNGAVYQSERVHQNRRFQAHQWLGHRQGLREPGPRLLPDLACRPEQNRGSRFRRAIGSITGCLIRRAILCLCQPRQRQRDGLY